MKRHSRTKNDFSETEKDLNNLQRSPHSEKINANSINDNEIEKHTTVNENDSLRDVVDVLESEIKMARINILNLIEKMKLLMVNNEQILVRKIENWIQGGLANIQGGVIPENEFLIDGLINNFETIIRNIEKDSVTDLNATLNDSTRILSKLMKSIKQSVRPRPRIDDARVTRRCIGTYQWIGLWSLLAVIIFTYPDYLLKGFEYAVAFYQSTILIFLLFSMLCLYSPIFK